MKVLVIVDMQNDFLYGPLGTPEAQAIIPVMVERLKEYEQEQPLVLFTKDTHYCNYSYTQEGKSLPIPHCIEGTPGWSICKDISSVVDRNPNFYFYSDSDIVRSRIYKNTFGSLRLAELLQNHKDQLDEIIFMGVCTDICVVSNALLVKASCPEVKITVDASCCAGTTSENHQAALQVMKCCQINVIGEQNEQQ